MLTSLLLVYNELEVLLTLVLDYMHKEQKTQLVQVISVYKSQLSTGGEEKREREGPISTAFGLGREEEMSQKASFSAVKLKGREGGRLAWSSRSSEAGPSWPQGGREGGWLEGVREEREGEEKWGKTIGLMGL